MPALPTLPAYNIQPNPTRGRGWAGLVPGLLDRPPPRYQGIQSAYPDLPRLTQTAGQFVEDEFRGPSWATVNAIQDEAARFGVESGMPLSQLQGYRGLRNLGRTVEEQGRRALQDYGSFMGTLAPVVEDPNTALRVAEENAWRLAAPDPEAAAAEQWRRYLQAARMAAAAGRSPGGGTMAGGGGGAIDPFWGRSSRDYDRQIAERQAAWQNYWNRAAGTVPGSTGSGAATDWWSGNPMVGDFERQFYEGSNIPGMTSPDILEMETTNPLWGTFGLYDQEQSGASSGGMTPEELYYLGMYGGG